MSALACRDKTEQKEDRDMAYRDDRPLLNDSLAFVYCSSRAFLKPCIVAFLKALLCHVCIHAIMHFVHVCVCIHVCCMSCSVWKCMHACVLVLV